MSPGCCVSRQERFCKMHRLSLMCCRITQALLKLLKEFPSWSKMPVLPGQALTFMAPDGTENGWFWIQLIKTTDRNTVQCCSQLFPWTGKGTRWMRCSVLICYLIHCPKFVPVTKFMVEAARQNSVQPLQCDSPIGNNKRRKNDLFLSSY